MRHETNDIRNIQNKFSCTFITSLYVLVIPTPDSRQTVAVTSRISIFNSITARLRLSQHIMPVYRKPLWLIWLLRTFFTRYKLDVNIFHAAPNVKLTDTQTSNTEMKNWEFSGWALSLKKSILLSLPCWLTEISSLSSSSAVSQALRYS
jgi:hypothetical protein